MNLRRHLNVLWRFRLIVVGGCLLGVVMGLLAVFQVEGGSLKWRAQQTWQSQSTLYVTQPGFPDGRVVLGDPASATAPEQQSGEQFADPGRFSNLAIVYSSFIQSDRVRAAIRPQPAPDQIMMTPTPAGMNSTVTLPIATLTTKANDPASAQQLNTSAITALQGFLESEQERNEIAADNRVRVEVLNPPTQASILIGRSKTPAIVAFILCVAGALALAYCLDNLGPRSGAEPALVEPLDLEPLDLEQAALEQAWGAPSRPSVAPTRRAS